MKQEDRSRILDAAGKWNEVSVLSMLAAMSIAEIGIIARPVKLFVGAMKSRSANEQAFFMENVTVRKERPAVGGAGCTAGLTFRERRALLGSRIGCIYYA